MYSAIEAGIATVERGGRDNVGTSEATVYNVTWPQGGATIHGREWVGSDGLLYKAEVENGGGIVAGSVVAYEYDDGIAIDVPSD